MDTSELKKKVFTRFEEQLKIFRTSFHRELLISDMLHVLNNEHFCCNLTKIH